MSTDTLALPALEVRQGERALYLFALDGKTIPQFAAVTRISRESGKLAGYQRPEVLRHIAEIQRYIESAAPLVPNAIVMAMGTRVRFVAAPGSSSAPAGCGIPGTLFVPAPEGLEDADKVAWVVDGQQRLAAVRDAAVESFPLCCAAFISDDVSQQVEQFMLVNSAKPLAKSLVYELLPAAAGHLPIALERRRLPAQLLLELNRRPESPLFGRIQTATCPAGLIKDTSALAMLEAALTDGSLYPFREGGGDPDIEGMLTLLSAQWSAVAATWPEAWALPPKKSRLTHGAGFAAVGLLLDTLHGAGAETQAQFTAALAPLRDRCAWTSGEWAGTGRGWSSYQNTKQDLAALSRHLLVLHQQASVKARKPLRAADRVASR